jgi:Bax protein
MASFRYLRYVFSFRLLMATMLLWVMVSNQAGAWQSAPYAYPAYAPGYVQPVYNHGAPLPPMVMPRYTQQGYPQHAMPWAYPYPVYRRHSSAPEAAPGLPAQAKLTPGLEQHGKESTPPQTRQSRQDAKSRKQAFIDRLLPVIERENARLQQIRQRSQALLHKLAVGEPISASSQSWLQQLARKYRVEGNPNEDSQARLELSRKVDIIPASLTLAQAANESAWGKSRFAVEANNLFGIWTYDTSKGLVPKKRDASKKHLVRKFADDEESVGYYMHMLNSHPAYQKLREIRYRLRQLQQPIDGQALAAGLEKYSAKGEVYIKLIRDLIRQNQWANLDNLPPSV